LDKFFGPAERQYVPIELKFGNEEHTRRVTPHAKFGHDGQKRWEQKPPKFNNWLTFSFGQFIRVVDSHIKYMVKKKGLQSIQKLKSLTVKYCHTKCSIKRAKFYLMK